MTHYYNVHGVVAAEADATRAWLLHLSIFLIIIIFKILTQRNL